MNKLRLLFYSFIGMLALSSQIALADPCSAAICQCVGGAVVNFGQYCPSPPQYQRSSSSPRPVYYAAISINPKTGSAGYSYNYSTRADAERAALGQCTGRKCEIAVWFSNTCGAVAYSRNTKKYAWSWGGDDYEGRALEACRIEAGRRGRDCKIVASVCTSR